MPCPMRRTIEKVGLFRAHCEGNEDCHFVKWRVLPTVPVRDEVGLVRLKQVDDATLVGNNQQGARR